MPCPPHCPLRHHPHDYDVQFHELLKENKLLKGKLDIAEEALKFIAGGEQEGHGPLEGAWVAQDALSKLSKLEGE